MEAEPGHAVKKTWVDTKIKSSREAFLEGLTTGLKNPIGKERRLIISLVGSEEGFVDGGLLIFKSKKKTEDYHDEMNSDHFEEWLRDSVVKAELLEIVNKEKHNYQQLAVDKLAAEHGVTILRLPPYQCELNPIELVWAQVKGHVARNNKTFKMTEVKQLFEEGLQLVTPQR
ncbi:uncharacterized protein LOC113233205 [Hyposmocoma kahamanoa]|uniref:uncharacterized protein LOC113233205 n=1 Tax=Hyposmocoma kahamanoa TaxID=1477025 RepID=UPI000E6D9B76|nr:uncharacterized protein LOC113233205 [Hyposmocoma kahamanoa]